MPFIPPRLPLSLALALLLTPAARADDWPQWLGPKRDGVWRENGVLDRFPKQGLAVRWRVPVGGGYAGPMVAAGRVYVMDFTPAADAKKPGNPFQRVTQPGTERVICVDQATGKVLWQHAYDAAYGMSYSAGPRTTPAFDSTPDGDRVYSLGGEGDLFCLNAADGKPVWSKHLSDDKNPTPMWGFASHPLVEGDSLICLTGGSDPAHGRGVVTAFDKRTGKVLWSALSAREPGYAPAVISTAGGVRQLIAWDPDALCALDPKTGDVLWTQPFGPVRMGVSIVTPRLAHDEQLGDVLFVATQYEGSLLLKLDDKGGKPTVLWKRAGKNERNGEALRTLISTASIRNGHIYGIDTLGELRCLNLKTGDRLWATNDATNYDAGPQRWSTAFLIPLGDQGPRYLIANEHGDLILADLDPKGYHEISRTHLLDPTNTDAQRPALWCHPALAGRCIFWRNDKEMICASLASPTP